MGNCTSDVKDDTPTGLSSDSCCCICLANINPRSGNPYISLGCCGIWYHQSCVDQFMASGGRNCPACRAPFPISLVKFTLSHRPAVAAPPPLPPTVPRVGHSVNGSGRLGSIRNMGTLGDATPARLSNVEEDVCVAGAGDQPQVRDGDTQLILRSFPEFDSVNAIGVESFRVVVSLQAQRSVEHCRQEHRHTNTQATAAVSPEAGAVLQADPYLPGTDSRTVPLDIIGVLDKSGSMGCANKLSNLLQAVDYIRSELTGKDRMGIVSFDSRASIVHNLLLMTPENKTLTREICRTIRAAGGTSILDGLQQALVMLEGRRTRNPLCAVFLLTDGVDDQLSSEKKDLVARMRSRGASVFVFGYGDDCDSKQLKALAEAGDGSFCFVESSEVVTDAFGGALGAEKSIVAHDLTLSVQCPDGVCIRDVFSGNYKYQLDETGKNVKVRFTNVMANEKRDIMLDLCISQVAAATSTDDYTSGSDGRSNMVIALPSISYKLPNVLRPLGSFATSLDEDSEVGLCSIDGQPCEVTIRTGGAKAELIRHAQVDVQINRQIFTRALETSTALADLGEMEQARGALQSALLQIEESHSYQVACSTDPYDPAVSAASAAVDAAPGLSTESVPVHTYKPDSDVTYNAFPVESVALAHELRQMLTSSLASHQSYIRGGGRAILHETSHIFTRQRSSYTREGHTSINQSSHSMVLQRQASLSRSSPVNT